MLLHFARFSASVVIFVYEKLTINFSKWLHRLLNSRMWLKREKLNDDDSIFCIDASHHILNFEKGDFFSCCSFIVNRPRKRNGGEQIHLPLREKGVGIEAQLID